MTGPWKTLRIKRNSIIHPGLNTNKEKCERKPFLVSAAHPRKTEI